MLASHLGLLAFAMSLAGAAAVAQGKELPRVAVKCLDADGKPVADAEVHLFQHKPAAEQRDGVRIALETGVEVRGIVRRVPDGAGVERVGVSAVLDDQYHMWRLAGAVTDPQGRFALRLPAGRARLYIGGAPRGYQQPSSEFTKLLRIDVRPDDTALTDIVFELDPAK